jgi:WD40 repeat protein
MAGAPLAEGSPVTSVAFGQGGQVMAVGDDSGHIGVWDVSTRRKTAALPEGAQVAAVAFIAGGPTLVAGDAGENVGIWNAVSGRHLANLAEGSAVASLAFSPSGPALAVGGLNGDVALIWQNLANLTQPYFTKLICGRVQGNMTRPQWQEYAPEQPFHQTCP